MRRHWTPEQREAWRKKTASLYDSQEVQAREWAKNSTDQTLVEYLRATAKRVDAELRTALLRVSDLRTGFARAGWDPDYYFLPVSLLGATVRELSRLNDDAIWVSAAQATLMARKGEDQ